MDQPQFSLIIEAGLDELIALVEPWEFSGAALSETILYAKSIIHFHRGHIEELKFSLKQAREGNLSPEVLLAIELRLAIRLRAIDPAKLKEAESLTISNSMWQGELSILIASAYMILGLHAEARNWYRKSIPPLEKIGSVRKSVRARANALAAETHLDSSRHFVPEHTDLYRKALAVGETAVAATCLLNISREYQIMSSHLAALKYVNDAMELTESNFGSLQHHLCLAHRSLLLTELGRMTEARLDLELLSSTPFPELKSAVEIVKSRWSDSEIANEENILPTWQERKEASSDLRLSELENSLLQALSDGPKSRYDLLSLIYGDLLDLEVRNNRFKSLIGTLRKKNSDLIVHENGMYRLADRIVIKRKHKA